MNTDSLALSNKDISIYVITTGDSERVSRINEFLFSLDFEFVQSDCLEELKILEERYKKISHRFRQKAIMSGEIGAFKTHAQAWERIIQSNKPGIIIEDNIDFIRKPSILMSSKVFDLIESCGLISFTDFSYKLFPNQPFIISSLPEKKPFPIVCYGVTPERALNLCQAMKKSAYVMPVDKWLAVPRLCGCYGFVSHFSVARRSLSLVSIANSKKGKKNINPINILHWVKNKNKYKY